VAGDSPEEVGQSLAELRQRLAELEDPSIPDERVTAVTDEIEAILIRLHRLKDALGAERRRRPLT